jgi:hypothetical protein
MADWGRVLEIAIAAAPAVASLLLAVWVFWFVRRLCRGLARLFRREPSGIAAAPETSRRTATRIEPDLDPVAVTPGADARELAATVQVLMQRVEALEQRLAGSSEPRGSGKTALRVVRNEEVEPA